MKIIRGMIIITREKQIRTEKPIIFLGGMVRIVDYNSHSLIDLPQEDLVEVCLWFGIDGF